MDFLDILSLRMAYQYVVKIKTNLTEEVTIWACKPLTGEAGKRHPQPLEKRVEERWTTLG